MSKNSQEKKSNSSPDNERLARTASATKSIVPPATGPPKAEDEVAESSTADTRAAASRSKHYGPDGSSTTATEGTGSKALKCGSKLLGASRKNGGSARTGGQPAVEAPSPNQEIARSGTPALARTRPAEEQSPARRDSPEQDVSDDQ